MTRYPTQTVLVVDDQTPVRRLISRMLTRSGYRTIEAASGVQALSLVARARGTIDLAIIDMMMPQMSGLDLAAELGRENPDLKILYISANSGSIAIDSIRRNSPEFLLLKPFTEQSLLERVLTLLDAQPGDQQIVRSATDPT